MNYAPIALFVYDRKEHTKRTVEALQQCDEAKNSDLIIFSDGAKGIDDIKKVDEVRRYIETISGFKSVKIFNRKTNYGLALNIIDGVSKVCDEYGQAIVIEDDIVATPCLLKFMNKALDFYKDDKKVFTIGASVPVDCYSEENKALMSEITNCWGWAIWKDRWDLYERNKEKAFYDLKNMDLRKRINIGNRLNVASQIDMNYKGDRNTWAVYLNYTSSKFRLINIFPPRSIITNIGQDGSGVHKQYGDVIQGYNIDVDQLKFTSPVSENMDELYSKQLGEEDENILLYNERIYTKPSKKSKKIQKIIDVIRGKI